MNLNFENPISGIADRARGRYDETLENVRRNTNRAAHRVTRGKKPVRTISRFGVKVSNISHRTANKLWRKQTKLVESQIDAVSEHLKAAAKAENLKDFVNAQIDLIPDHTTRFADEARDAIEIFKGAGSEFRGALRATVDELRGLSEVASKTPPIVEPKVMPEMTEPAEETLAEPTAGHAAA